MAGESRLAAIGLALGPYERRAYTAPDILLANYESVRQIVAHRYPNARPARVVPYAPETSFFGEPPGFRRTQVPRAVPTIVAVSRHDPRKGVAPLLAALRILRDRRVEFTASIVGPGALLGAHRRLRDRLDLGNVEIPGRVVDTGRYLERGALFVLPSLEESSGSISLLEAMRAELCIVASNCDGIPEDIIDGVSGLLVPPGDATALADAIERVVASPDLRARLAAGGRAEYERRFTAASMTASIAGVYRELGFEVGAAIPDDAPTHGHRLPAI